jgi:mannitol-specific phosphotransferase system IIBC component
MRKIKVAVSVLASAIVGVVVNSVINNNNKKTRILNLENKSYKYQTLFKMMNQWVIVKQDGKNLESYFKKKGYKKIAIYGMSHAGETLLRELKNTQIEVVYAIDRRAETLYTDIDVVTKDDVLEDVDAIVVTAISFFEEIEKELSRKLDCPIISLEDVLYDV